MRALEVIFAPRTNTSLVRTDAFVFAPDRTVLLLCILPLEHGVANRAGLFRRCGSGIPALLRAKHLLVPARPKNFSALLACAIWDAS
jgi:hypothetical protein